MGLIARILICSVVLAAVSAGAGTAYVNFDGDDGSGSSLPAGVGGAATVGSVAGFYLDPTYDGSTATVAPGAGLVVNLGWGSESLMILEYTVTNMQTQYAYDPNAAYPNNGPLFGWAMYGSPGGLASMGSVLASAYAGGGAVAGDIYAGIYAVSSIDAEAIAPTATRMTVRVVMDPAGATDVYIAFDANATTPTVRPRTEDMIQCTHYPAGNFVTGLYIFELGNWGASVTIDDLIIEGENVPDIGTPPPYAAAPVEAGRITASPTGWVEEGTYLTMTAPDTTAVPPNYIWRKDGQALAPDGSRLTGVTEQVLVFDTTVIGDTGTYTVSYDDGSKVIVETEPLYLNVLAVGALPVTGLLGLGVLALGTLGASALAIRRKRK